ncbi:DnaJ domain-containing protein [Patescibacteria group bacterium]|nr:DnaJ domain-containing protein [Patescibacteria group bacterium]MBP9710338.1 DnaJ domain-containing protein [Patescibacteria group bacterium]
MYCKYCGKSLVTKGNFCGFCGKKIVLVAETVTLGSEELKQKLIKEKKHSIWMFSLLGVSTLVIAWPIAITCVPVILFRFWELTQIQNEPVSATVRRWELIRDGVPSYEVDSVLGEELKKKAEGDARKKQKREQEEESRREYKKRQEEGRKSEEYRRKQAYQKSYNPVDDDVIKYLLVLGLPQKATKKEIVAAYRRLAHVHHPDKGGDAKQFGEIKNAYDNLMRRSD